MVAWWLAPSPSQQEGPGFLCGLCMFSPCVLGFPLGTSVSTSPKNMHGVNVVVCMCVSLRWTGCILPSPCENVIWLLPPSTGKSCKREWMDGENYKKTLKSLTVSCILTLVTS